MKAKQARQTARDIANHMYGLMGNRFWLKNADGFGREKGQQRGFERNCQGVLASNSPTRRCRRWESVRCRRWKRLLLHAPDINL